MSIIQGRPAAEPLSLSAADCIAQAAVLEGLARMFPDRAATFRAGERRWRQMARLAQAAEVGPAARV